MRKILILGSGAGGTIVANMLRKELDESEWEITILFFYCKRRQGQYPDRACDSS